jgi:Ca2+-binding EF-hand superfamily protein
MRIDAILYQGKRMKLLDAYDLPALTCADPIPNAEHPSDHLPVKATFRLRSWLEVTKQSAREWYLRQAGITPTCALTPQELRDAFMIYDHDGSGRITARRMTDAITDLMGPGVVSRADMDRLLERVPKEGMDLRQFVEAFKTATLRTGIPMLRDVKDVFAYFDKDDSGALEINEFLAMLTDCSPVNVPREEIEELFRNIDVNDDKSVSMEEYVDYLSNMWIQKFTV